MSDATRPTLLPEDDIQWLRIVASQLQEGCLASAAACDRMRRIADRLEAQLAAQSEREIPHSELEVGQTYLCWLSPTCEYAALVFQSTGEWMVLPNVPGIREVIDVPGFYIRPVRKLTPPTWAERTEKEIQ